MTYDYRLYAFQASMYSGKVRGYMNYKRLNYIEKSPHFLDMAYTIPAKTGERVVPVVKTRDGLWIQDTTIIIEELERRHPERSIGVETPLHYMASLLLEAWGDEYWLPVSMHHRWSYKDENYDFFLEDVGKSLLPGMPKGLQRRAGKISADRLDSAAPVMGFIHEQREMLDAWTDRTLDALEAHFSSYDYLLGGRPTIADYSLLASFYGHLDRDPAPKRRLMPQRPNLSAWVKRVHLGDDPKGELFENDELPDSLMPILRCVFSEFLPMVAAYKDNLARYLEANSPQSGDTIPRFLGPAVFPMGNSPYSRRTMPYTLWMMQRVRDKFLAMDEAGQQRVDAWMAQTFGVKLAELDLGPPLVRHGLSTKLA